MSQVFESYGVPAADATRNCPTRDPENRCTEMRSRHGVGSEVLFVFRDDVVPHTGFVAIKAASFANASVGVYGPDWLAPEVDRISVVPPRPRKLSAGILQVPSLRLHLSGTSESLLRPTKRYDYPRLHCCHAFLKDSLKLQSLTLFRVELVARIALFGILLAPDVLDAVTVVRKPKLLQLNFRFG
jgi:hypothetical protein